MNRLAFCLAAGVAGLLISGCGGSSGSSSNTSPTSPFNGIYRTSFTRGTTAVTVYLNYPEVEIVATDESGSFPSFVGTSNSAVSTVGGVLTFTSVPLTGSDGESALASGTFATASSGTGNAVNVAITGGLGYNGQIPLTTATTNGLYVGTYSGTYSSTYSSSTLTGATTTEPAGSVTSLTLSPDSTTGGYDMTATGTTTDPSGNAVSFAINDAQVDPAGIIPSLSVTFSYANGLNTSVTNTYSNAYLNLGVQATTTLVGYLHASTTNWANAPIETDNLVLTQQSTTALKAK